MADPTFLATLIHEVAIKRPTADATAEGNLQSTQFADVYAARQRCRIMPAGGRTDPGLLGRFPDATHVMYCEKLDVKPNYLIELELTSTTLALPAEAGAAQVSVASIVGLDIGSIVEVSHDLSRDEAQVTLLDVNVLHIVPALGNSYPEGASVRSTRLFDVMGVDDEAGAGHHLRVIMREREV